MGQVGGALVGGVCLPVTPVTCKAETFDGAMTGLLGTWFTLPLFVGWNPIGLSLQAGEVERRLSCPPLP